MGFRSRDVLSPEFNGLSTILALHNLVLPVSAHKSGVYRARKKGQPLPAAPLHPQVEVGLLNHDPEELCAAGRNREGQRAAVARLRIRRRPALRT